MSKRQFLVLSVLIPVMIVSGAGVGLYTYRQHERNFPPQIQGLLWPDPKPIRQFSMIDQFGNPFGSENLSGKWSFFFFGYTHCPDVCPITLAVLNQVLGTLARVAGPEDVQIIFVSVDTERDTPEKINEYVSYFNREIIGLGGTADQLHSLASQIGIVYLPGEKSESGEYYVDHTASVFLVDPWSRLVSVFSAPHSADNILARFELIREFIEERMAS